LTRSTRDLLNVLGAVADRGAGFKSLRDTWADTTTPQTTTYPDRPQKPTSITVPMPFATSRWPPHAAAANCGALLDRAANLV